MFVRDVEHAAGLQFIDEAPHLLPAAGLVPTPTEQEAGQANRTRRRTEDPLGLEDSIPRDDRITGPGGIEAIIKLEDKSNEALIHLQAENRNLMDENKRIMLDRDELRKKVVQLESIQACNINQVYTFFKPSSQF